MNKLPHDSHIKNIVFDIGNVLVKWSPENIVANTFDDSHNHQQLFQKIFKHDLWKQLNKGAFTENTAKELYRNHLDLDNNHVDLLFHNIKDSQDLIAGTFNLLKKLHASHYQLYGLTDNVIEIIDFLKEKYDFWKYFQGVVISAEIGYLKPSHEIYNHLLNRYSLTPQETLFIDDSLLNIRGARALGIHGIQFLNPTQCENELRNIIDF